MAGAIDINMVNKYLKKVFIPRFNKDFCRTPRESGSVFNNCNAMDLNQVFCFESNRVVNKDITIGKTGGRHICNVLHLIVREHLDGSYLV